MALTNTFTINHNAMSMFPSADLQRTTKRNAQTNGSATPEKPRRTRKIHNKVRTGCLTCKIRRKKCDETKPACNRCTSTGRKCDGYDTHLEAPKAPSSATRTKVRPVPAPTSPDDTAVFVKDFEKKILALASAIRRNNDVAYEVPRILDSEDAVNDEELEDFILSYGASSVSSNNLTSSDYPVTNTESSLSPPSPATPSPTSARSMKTRQSTPTKFGLIPILPRAPNFFSPTAPITDVEAHCFSYFRYHTGPQFASYFDSSIWRNYTIKGALAHPLLFTVAAALGAAHRRFGYGISREAFEYCGHAARLHAKAIQGLAELKREHVNRGLVGSNSAGGGGGMGVYDRDVIMVAEMLLGLFEGFQANYDTAVGHMNNGLRYLLDRPMTLCHSESRYCAVESKPNTFCQLFHRLHCRALQLFGSPTKILVKWSEGATLPPIPTVFSSLEEARDYIFTEVEWIMHAPAKGWQEMVQRHDAQHVHVNRLLRWSVAYAETVVGMERTPAQKRACMLMKLCRNATYLLLYLTLFIAVDSSLPKLPTISETIDDDEDQDCGLAYATKALWDEVARREDLNINLGRVKVLADGLMEEHGIFNYDEHSASFDTSIGPPDSSNDMPDSSKKTRHLVQRLMRKNPDNDESLWQVMGVYGVAERISALEEHAVIDAVRSIIPAHVDPKWIDITCLLESRKILLRYCRPDEHGLGVMWQQEWWAF